MKRMLRWLHCSWCGRWLGGAHDLLKLHGDGVTDNTLAIQDAIFRTGGVRLAVGTFRISAPIDGPGFVHGAGPGKTIITGHSPFNAGDGDAAR